MRGKWPAVRTRKVTSHPSPSPSLNLLVLERTPREEDLISLDSRQLDKLSPESCCLLSVGASGKGRGPHQGLRPADAAGV